LLLIWGVVSNYGGAGSKSLQEGHKKPSQLKAEREKENAMEKEEEEEAVAAMVKLGSYGGEVRLMVGGEESAAEETMLLWGIQQPTLSKPNAFVSQSSLQLSLDTCGHSLSILQSPSSLVSFSLTLTALVKNIIGKKKKL